MAITKILNIKESEGRNPASHLKNALEYIQNPDKTEECVLVGGINCLPDTAFEQMEETKNIFHKTGKRQGYHVIISFSSEEKVTAEQAMYVLEHFAKAVLGDDYEAVYAVHTDREHMHGHLIWNSVSMTTGKKYNSPKSNWKNHLQPITNKYCDELGLSIMPAEYSRNPKNISRDKWEKEMSMKEIILRDAKMCAYAAGNVEHFKYMMKRLGYVFKKDAWMEVQAPGFRYYHKLAKLDEMFSEDMLRHYVDMPWMSKPHFYSSDIRDVVELVKYRSEQQEKMQRIDDRQKEIYKENSSRKRKIKTDEQYREYQVWHVGVQEELDELKSEKREVKKQLQLVESIMKEDLYTAYYAVSEDEEIIGDTEICRKEDFSVIDEQRSIEKEQTDVYNAEQIYTGKNVAVDDEVPVIPMAADKVEWIAERLSACGVYEEINAAVKADIFRLDIADVSGSIRLFSDIMKRLGIRLAGDELYEEFQRIYDESVSRDAGKEKTEDKMWNRGRWR